MEIPVNVDPGFEIPGDDPLDRARHCFKKGCMEFNGGPMVFEQGHGYTYKEFNSATGMIEEKMLMDNNRARTYEPAYLSKSDGTTRKLGVDVQEY